MGWKLELVETGQGPASRRIAVARLGEIGAPGPARGGRDP